MAGRYPPALPHTAYRMPLLASLCYPTAVLRSPSPPLPWQQLSDDELAADVPLDLSVRSGLGETAEEMRGGFTSRHADYIEGSGWCDVGEAADRQQQSQHQQQTQLELPDDQPLDLTVSSAACVTRHYRPPARTASSRHGAPPAYNPATSAEAEGFTAAASVPDGSRRLPSAVARSGRGVEAWCDPVPLRMPARDGTILNQSDHRDNGRSLAMGNALSRLTCFAASEASDRSSDGARPSGTSLKPHSWSCDGSPWPTSASVVQRPFGRTANRLALPYASPVALSNPRGRPIVRHSSAKLDLEQLGLRPSHSVNDGAPAWPGACLAAPVAQEAAAPEARQSTTTYEPQWETKRNVKRLATVSPQQGVVDRRRKQPRPAEVTRLPVERPASPASYRSLVDVAQLAPQPRACANLGSCKDRLLPPPPVALGQDFKGRGAPTRFASPTIVADRRTANGPSAVDIPFVSAASAAARTAAASAESAIADPSLNATSRSGKTEAAAWSHQPQVVRSQPAKRRSSFDHLSEQASWSMCDLVKQPIKRSKEFAFDRDELASLGGGGGGGSGSGSGTSNGKISLASYIEAAATRVFLREKVIPPTDFSALLLLQWPQGDRQDGTVTECSAVSPTAVADNLIGVLHQAVERGVRQQSVSPSPILEESLSKERLAAAPDQPLPPAACPPAAEALQNAHSFLASQPVASVMSILKEEKLASAADKPLPASAKPIPVSEKLVPIAELTSLAASTRDTVESWEPAASNQRVTKDASEQELPLCDTCCTAAEKQLSTNSASASGILGGGRAAAGEATSGRVFLKAHLAAPRKSTTSLETDTMAASELLSSPADVKPESRDICCDTAARGSERSGRAIVKPSVAALSSAPSPPPHTPYCASGGGDSDPGKPFVGNRFATRQHSRDEGHGVQSKPSRDADGDAQGTADKLAESQGGGQPLLVCSCGPDHTADEISPRDCCSATGCRVRPPSSSAGRQLPPASLDCCAESPLPVVEAAIKGEDQKDASPLGEAVTVAVSTECMAKCDGDTDKMQMNGGSAGAPNDAADGGSLEKWASMTNGEGRLVLVKVKYCCRHRPRNGEATATVEVTNGGSAEKQVANGAS